MPPSYCRLLDVYLKAISTQGISPLTSHYHPNRGTMHIVQDVLPSRYPTLPARCFNSKEIDSLLSAIRHTGATYLGTSLQLSAEGHVEAVAFATTNEAFYVTLQGSARGESATHASKAKPNSTALSSRGTTNLMTAITSGLGITLAGFSMARFALHVHRDKRWHVNGVDLSSLLVSTSERPHYPSDFISKTFDPDINRRSIDALWYPDPDDDDEAATDRVCLRAWISAVLVLSLVSEQNSIHADTPGAPMRRRSTWSLPCILILAGMDCVVT